MLRVGLIGLGVWGMRLLQKLLDARDFEVLAVYDPSAQGGAFPIPVCSRAEEFWKFSLEAVVVAAPPAVQGHLGVEVLRRCLPLFIEKPMALSLSVAEEIVALAHANDLIVHVDHLVRYDSLHLGALSRLARGDLGEPVGSVHVRHGSRPRPGVSAHSVLFPHDLSLAHAAFGEEGNWEATRTMNGVLARRESNHGGRVMLWSGPSGPPRRQTLYLGSRRAALVSEGLGLRILSAPKAESLRTMDGPLTPGKAEEVEHLFSVLAAAPALEEQAAGGDALSASLADFAQAVRAGRPSVCDANDGARVTRALVAIDAALGGVKAPVLSSLRS